MAINTIIRQQLYESNAMAPKYEIGEKVKINPVNNQHLSPRDSDLEQYAGQIGEVKDHYWISLDRGAKVLYIYTIRIGTSHEEIVLHEDELEPYTARNRP